MQSQELTPQRLIDSYCRKGDQRSFQRFYDQHSGRLWRVLVGRGCHPDTAYELVGEAFLRFSSSCCKDTSAPVALLYRIALNLHIDTWRHDQASPLLPWDDSAESVAAPGGASAENAIYLRQILKSLNSSEQNLLVMRYWIGMTHKEIAEALDTPEGTVRRQVAVILNRLQENWPKP